MHLNIDADIISIHQGEAIIMYYNIRKQMITLLAVLAPYNRRYLSNDNTYLFYDFIKDIEQSQKTFMSYDDMIDNALFVLKHFSIVVPKHVKYHMT